MPIPNVVKCDSVLRGIQFNGSTTYMDLGIVPTINGPGSYIKIRFMATNWVPVKTPFGHSVVSSNDKFYFYRNSVTEERYHLQNNSWQNGTSYPNPDGYNEFHAYYDGVNEMSVSLTNLLTFDSEDIALRLPYTPYAQSGKAFYIGCAHGGQNTPVLHVASVFTHLEFYNGVTKKVFNADNGWNGATNHGGVNVYSIDGGVTWTTTYPTVSSYTPVYNASGLSRGIFTVGLSSTTGYGPSSDSGFWNGYTPIGSSSDNPSSSYCVYVGDPTSDSGYRISHAANSSELIYIYEKFSGQSTTSVEIALKWFNSNDNYMVSNFDYADIVTDGLVLNFDAYHVASYPKTANTWYNMGNISDGDNATLLSGMESNWNPNGYFNQNGVGSTVYATIPNSNATTITKEMTVEAWIYPYNISIRSNYWSRAYGGVGAITYEPSGALNFYWGISGINGGTYNTFGTNGTPCSTLNKWYHVVITRSIINNELKWYINGTFNNSRNAVYSEAVAGNNDTRIGNGYTGTAFNGRIAIVREYNIALSADQVLQNYNAQSGRF